MRGTVRNVAIGLTALFLVGCSLLPGLSTAALKGEWQLRAGSNQGAPIPLVAGSPITLNFNGTRIGGTAACNSYGGALAVNGATIKISELLQTEMACVNDGVMASEGAYLAALPRVTAATRDGNSLLLSGAQVELHFALIPPVADANLVGVVWVLDSLISGGAVSTVAAKEATLQLKPDGTLSASTGCRTVSGRYTISGNVVQVTLDPYDMIACADPLGSQDTHELQVLGGAKGFTVVIRGTSMTLSSGDQGLGYRVRAGT